MSNPTKPERNVQKEEAEHHEGAAPEQRTARCGIVQQDANESELAIWAEYYASDKQGETALWTGVEGIGSIHNGDGSRGIR